MNERGGWRVAGGCSAASGGEGSGVLKESKQSGLSDAEKTVLAGSLAKVLKSSGVSVSLRRTVSERRATYNSPRSRRAAVKMDRRGGAGESDASQQE